VQSSEILGNEILKRVVYTFLSTKVRDRERFWEGQSVANTTKNASGSIFTRSPSNLQSGIEWDELLSLPKYFCAIPLQLNEIMLRVDALKCARYIQKTPIARLQLA
jgi:hypothetical protein